MVTFEPHSRPVSGLRVPPHATHKLLSCAHDGVVRCIDLLSASAFSFVELYRSPDDGVGDYPKLHAISRTAGEGGIHAICRDDGVTVMMDPRLPLGAAHSATMHEKKIFSADFSPTAPWLVATASLDRTVALWDVRSLAGGGKKQKAITSLDHGLSVTAVRFSPNGSRLLTTCNDDLLRVFEAAHSARSDTGWELRTSVKHYNKTGRFVLIHEFEPTPQAC